MTKDELKARCEALASVGDEQAKATLRLFTWGAEDESALKLKAAVDEAKRELSEANRKLGNAVYVLSKITGTMTLWGEMQVKATAEKGIVTDSAGHGATVPPFAPPAAKRAAVAEPHPGVLHRGEPIAPDLEKMPVAKVPPPKPASAVRDPKPGEQATAEELARIRAVAREFGIDPGSPEAAAVAHTRKVNGLAETTPPEMLAVNPAAAAGAYDKTSKMGEAAGNKGE